MKLKSKSIVNQAFVNQAIAICIGMTAVSFLSSCTDHSKPNYDLIQDMMESPAIKPQEFDENSPNHSGMRVPPEGTQPVGFIPYRYAKDLEGAAKNQNPLAGQYTEETLKTGLKYYSTNCAICHGDKGEGGAKSSIGEKMSLPPPSLLSEKINKWTDGQIYHVITMGQGVMGPYASHIPQKYRWQVVNYIRHLQKENK
jgi:mono/diheme cytochrome c family protein